MRVGGAVSQVQPFDVGHDELLETRAPFEHARELCAVLLAPQLDVECSHEAQDAVLPRIRSRCQLYEGSELAQMEDAHRVRAQEEALRRSGPVAAHDRERPDVLPQPRAVERIAGRIGQRRERDNVHDELTRQVEQRHHRRQQPERNEPELSRRLSLA